MQRHATDVVSLVFGVIFTGFTLVWLLNVTDLIDFEQAWLAGPVILVAAGAVGLLTALRPPARRGVAPQPTERSGPDDS